MKYLVIALAFLVPSFTFAAPLTTEQATSLITVVQSSPGTPASAFTDLITAFSNITETQANSLISVVQAAPGVPADSFVNMLIAFTVDTIVEPTPAPTPIPTPTPTPDLGNSNPQVATTTPEVVVESTPMDKSEILIVEERHEPNYVGVQVSVLDSDGNYIKNAEITAEVDGETSTFEANSVDSASSKDYKGEFRVYGDSGTKTVTFSYGELTKSVDISF